MVRGGGRTNTTLIFFLVAAVGYGVAVWAGAALAWDGAWYLWRTVYADGQPFIAHGRWANWPALATVLGASRLGWGFGPWGLARLDGALLALIPLGSLAVCWRLWRGPLEPLRAWAALGVLVAPLPGQWALMSEATLVAQLGWPLLALAGAGRGGWPAGLAMAGIAAATWGFHPSAAVFFALAAGVSAWRSRWLTATVFAGLAVARLGWTAWEATPYERSEISLGRVWEQWVISVWGWPLVILGGMGLVGVMLTLRAAGRVGEAPAVTSIVAIGCATAAAGLWWASDAARWGGSLDYRRWVLPAGLPLLAAAGWHGRRIALFPADRNGNDAHFRLAALAAAGICAVTFWGQSRAWTGLLTRWTSAIRAPGPTAFVTAEELPWLRGTALDHWTGCPLSLWVENGQRPERAFVLRADDVRENGAAVQVTPWDRLVLPATASRR